MRRATSTGPFPSWLGCLALMVSTCVSQDFADGQFRCDPTDRDGCPEGMTCAGDGTCRSPGGTSSGAAGSGGDGLMGGAGGAAGGAGGVGGAGGGACEPLIIGATPTDFTFGERTGALVTAVTTDTTLWEKEPTRNDGGARVLWADGQDSTGAKAVVSVLRFDLCRVPPSTVVTAATLSLWVADVFSKKSTCDVDCGGSGPGTTVTLHELLESWTEGGEDGKPGIANFNLREWPDVPWTDAGAGSPGSRGATMAPSIADPTEIAEITRPLDPPVVQGWIDQPDTNHGVALAMASADGVGFTSSDAVTGDQGADEQARRPLLTLTLSSPQ